MMERITFRVSDALSRYYPDDQFSIRRVERVATKPGSSVYRIRIFDKVQGHRELYAKEYRESAGPNIHEIMRLKAYHKLFLIPRILEYQDGYGGGILISEGIAGDTLTRAFFKGIMSTNREKLLECSKKMGWAIGALQNRTPRGSHKVGDLKNCLVTEIFENYYFKWILSKALLTDLREQAEELKGLKTRVAQCHGDPSPHNIILEDDRVYLLDYSFSDNATFMDPCLYIVSLELVKNRMDPLMRQTVSLMEDKFMETYTQMTKETYDRPIWTTIKTLTYLHFLLVYATRQKTIKNVLVGSVDSRYLLRQVKEALK